ncbi:Phosphodiesterase [Paramyrothecium foliicola]|nr:Phosphodiesterase [Paramyrothecium foliicola]
MDKPACHIVYVNRAAGEDRHLRSHTDENFSSASWQNDRVRDDVQPLVDAFGDVHICASGPACIAKVLELQDDTMMDMRPTIILLDTPNDEPVAQPYPSSRPASPCSQSRPSAEIHTPDEDIYGLKLLQKLVTEAHLRSISKLIVPVPIISHPQAVPLDAKEQMTDGTVEPFTVPLGALAVSRRLVRRCLDLGAVDVIISPLSSKCITTLEICAYKAHREAAREQQALLEVRRGRKRSWVGVNEQEPFAYLREAMVSGLMNGICRLSSGDDQITSVHIAVSSERQATIAAAVGRWYFCAHSFTDDELLVAAMVMFKHALSMPELEHWRIPSDQLISYLVACRAAYNSFVPYHNFRHVVDVLQATFNFLLHIGALPSYPLEESEPPPGVRSPIATLLNPFEALTLLITAIGHDVGHPGVNNGFLTTLNAPLAQLYNDRSVLESFHCAAYSQILRRYWPAVFEDRKMRGLMISSILATDMGLHFDYMKKLGDLQEKLQHHNSTDGWNGRQMEENRTLACSLLIKCADICNVARRYDTAVQWMHILSEEFSRQASMENELEIKSSLLAPPKKDLLSLLNAQLGFMNMFAIPLFQGVADIMPGMQYTVDELETNKSLFEGKVQDEKAKQLQDDVLRQRFRKEGTFSPRTMSYAAPSDSVNNRPESTSLVDRASKALNSSQGADDDSTAAGATTTTTNTPEPKASIVDMQHSDSVQESLAPAPPSSKAPYNFSDGQDPNGVASSFDAVRELAESDPFNTRDTIDGYPDHKQVPSSGQRCSETTEGSASGAYAGDWASQATSAATGKAPISPSTRGTSLVSKESMERGSEYMPSVHVSRPSTEGSPATLRRDGAHTDEESLSTGSIGKAEGKSLKKKPSWFRMKDLPFFRRHKGSSSPCPATDTAG